MKHMVDLNIIFKKLVIEYDLLVKNTQIFEFEDVLRDED